MAKKPQADVVRVTRTVTTKQVPAMVRRAMVDPESINEDDRTVDIVWTTGESVLRGFSEYDRYYERLSLDPKHVRMERLNSGAPLLNSHNAFDLKDVIGVVESARLEKTRGVAKVRFAKAEHHPEADAVLGMVRDGVIRNVSVGYRAHRLEKVSDGEGEIPEMLVTDWEPYEISMVPIGADAGASVRSEGATTNPCEFVAEERAMKPKAKSTPVNVRAEGGGQDQPDETDAEKTGTGGAGDEGDGAGEQGGEGTGDAGDAGDSGDAEQGGEQPNQSGDGERRSLVARAGERARILHIQRIGRTLGVAEKVVQRAIERGDTVAKFRAEAQDIFERDGRIETGHGRIEVGSDARDKFRRCATDWLIQRTGQAAAVVEAGRKRGQTVKLDPGEAGGMTLLRLAEDCLLRAGVKTRGMNPLRIAELAFDTRAGGYHTTSDFPGIIDSVVDTTLLANYVLAEDAWRKLAKVGSVSDFKLSRRLRLGTLGRLDKVPEHAEFKNKEIPDGVSETVQIQTFGNIFAVTRQVIVNDDLGAILRLVEDAGRAAGHTIELEFWDLLGLNGGLGPVMSDAKTLFHADHGNIQPTGTALGVAGLDANRVLMAAITDPSGNRIVMRPHTLLVGTAYGMAARNFNTAEFDIDAGDGVTPNGVRNLFEEVIDSPYVAGTRRYIFADPQRNPTFEVNFLNGQQTPFTESRDGWRIDGKEYKVRHDFGVNAVDWRTAITDDGTP